MAGNTITGEHLSMYTIFYGESERTADWLIEHTKLDDLSVRKRELFDSDSNNSGDFHKLPPRIKEVIHLDAPDLVLSANGKPLLTVEISTEAGTGHNPLQRFSRLATSLGNEVPSFYIFPEAKWITRQGSRRWDKINPICFRSLEAATRIHDVPAIHFYYPSEYNEENPEPPDNQDGDGLLKDNTYPECPLSRSQDIKRFFNCVDTVIQQQDSRSPRLLNHRRIRRQRDRMQARCAEKDGFHDEWSPLTSVEIVPTGKVLDYLSDFYSNVSKEAEHIASRPQTVIYHAQIQITTQRTEFRDDPYVGALAALDYLKCRVGESFLDRDRNLMFCFGKLEIGDSIRVTPKNKENSSVNRFTDEVSKVMTGHNSLLLGSDYSDLDTEDIPRYFMHVQHGTKYSLNKGIRCYAYPVDGLLFHDGAFWRPG